MTVVAIDGPAGAGKTTVARAVATRLGWSYLDTGAMYRAVALAAIQRGIDPTDRRAIERLVAELDIAADGDSVVLDGRDVSERIRDEDVTKAVSTVSAHPGVRSALVARQRAAARAKDVVIEGRDIGSAVFPDAEHKIYLTAAPEERARRRALQMELPTDDSTLTRIAEEIRARDHADATRESSPLMKPPNAVVIDSTHMTFDDVVDRIVKIVEARHAG